ncbi:secreted RxLR effector peptide protein, putative [Phytophthora infestans T30-4]|uniref:RxLR effector protein n=2 Tax=Phytophthora infestans TaxID=4787 RepID=D0NPU3_PHYIT|nr:secreted RxLR effector peptide protein, putative [Phytophthora infestans T30-4]EEY62655.1 secreted RxLR effector peptide protein, putative [Phytophthora infestans T30-4]KAF4030819.1 RXLR domain-containing protein [Phytophthora infestans]|eukprot:XP_002898897.1 secreted RxLR effector peptide protein, putative [Phytophthora infestans T30-4]
MKLSLAFVVAAALGFVAQDALSAPTEIANGLDASLDPGHDHPSGHGRVLRGHIRHSTLNNDNVDEERFKLDKITEMLTDISYRTKKFYKWKYTSKLSDDAVYKKLRVDQNPTFRTLFYKYQDY